MARLSPVKLRSVFKDYIWGGTKLKTEFGKCSGFDIIAESWELAAHKDGESVVGSGEYAGLSLTEYIEKAGHNIIGANAERFDYFPILIKLIDAHDRLSVQVHPNDEYALREEGEYGKTEMWYVLDCKDGAMIYYGFNRDITRAEYEMVIKENKLIDLLNAVPVHKGDMFFIPAGTVHAIGAGIIICEIQQNSNTTYRVYDYNRRDKSGNTRPLHIEKAVEVSDLRKTSALPHVPDGCDVTLASCDYFTVRRLRIDGSANINIDSSSFRSLIITDGSGEMTLNNEMMTFCKGDSVFIPAQDGICSISGRCEIILSCI